MTWLTKAGISLPALVLLATPALAMSITNRDTAEHTVTIVSGDKETEHKLGAEAALEDGCEDGCVVRVAGWDGEFEAKADDVLVIKDGKVHTDE